MVPVYNHEKFVGLALDSLLAQTDQDWEACVVDDGSTDGTPAIIDDYARLDRRIRVFHKTNGGEASALNAAWREAKGTWIGWLSSDDLYLPNKLAIHREWIKVYSECRYFFTDFQTLDDKTGDLKKGYIAQSPEKGRELLDLLAANYINGISMCVHREIFDAVGAFDEISRHGQDYDFHLRAVARYAPTRIPLVTCVQRMHEGQLSRQHTCAMFYDCSAVAIRFLNMVQSAELMGPICGCTVVEGKWKLEEALTVAASPNSYVNLLGPHPAMLFKIITWVAESVKNNPAYCSLTGTMGHKVRSIIWGQPDSTQVGIWQAISVLCDLSALPNCSAVVQVEDVIDVAWFRAKARGEESASTLTAYASNRQQRQIAVHDSCLCLPFPSVVWIPQTSQNEAEIQDCLRISKALVESGIGVVILNTGSSAIVWNRGLLKVTVPCLRGAMYSLAATPGNLIVLLLPGQRSVWWWSWAWRVVSLDTASIAELSRKIAPTKLSVFDRKRRFFIVRIVGWGYRIWRRVCSYYAMMIA